MARKTRIHYPGALYHVILRGLDGQEIFFTEEDYSHFCALLAEGVERFDCKIHAFCLMTNHLHLAIQVGKNSLSRVMQNVNFRYTRWINTRQNRTGPLFHGRYKAVLVDRDSYLLDLVRYIHLNPTRSGLGLDPKNHKWSSQKAYCDLEQIDWLTKEVVLSEFDPHDRIAINRYQRFVVDGLREGHRPEFQKGSGVDVRVLGDVDFIDQMKEQLPVTPIETVDLQTVIDLVLGHYRLTMKQLRAPGKGRTVSEARAVAALIIFEDGIDTLEELGQKIDRAGSTLSSAVTRLKKRMQTNSQLTQTVQGIRDQILQQ